MIGESENCLKSEKTVEKTYHGTTFIILITQLIRHIFIYELIINNFFFQKTNVFSCTF